VGPPRIQDPRPRDLTHKETRPVLYLGQNIPAGGSRPNRRRLRREYFAKEQVQSVPPLCRPAGWVCLWRRIGTVSVLNRQVCG